MTSRKLSIGELSRASGLSVSALRFYDRQGLLVPDEVAEHSGYRWYAPEQVEDAKLVASLRRVGMPLAEMTALLLRKERGGRLLDEHVQRLEEGLAAARAEVRDIRERWHPTDGGRDDWHTDLDAPPASAGTSEPLSSADAQVHTTAGELAAGLRAVRHAIGNAPDFPAIHGVLLVGLTGALRLAATDRVRGAFAEVPAQCQGKLRLLLPGEYVDALAMRLTQAEADAVVLLSCRDRRLELRVDEEVALDVEVPRTHFPDLSHAIPKARHSADIDGAELGRALAAHPAAKAWWLCPDGRLIPDGVGGVYGVSGVESDVAPSEHDAVLLDAGYLAEALEALRHDEDDRCQVQLRLDLDGPAHPLALRRAADPGTFVVLLPIRPAPGPVS